MRRFSPNVALVVGGGSGIGAGLAAARHERGATVVVAGRRRETLDAVAAGRDMMMVEGCDVAAPNQVYALAERVGARHPHLDAVISTAGIQTLHDFAAPGVLDREKIGREVDLIGLIHTANAFLPLVERQSRAWLVHVGSGLGYVPLAAAPVYSAIRAAVHSFSISLCRQFAGSAPGVVEIIPAVVGTQLHRYQPAKPLRSTPLDIFVTAAMASRDARRNEIPIGLARVLRIASRIAPDLFLGIVNKAADHR